MKLKLLDLFSGIGGFSLGLESTGQFETIAFVEKDEFCQKVLKKNFNNIPIESEVRNVKGDRYAADIITGGFPCQPFSVAGKRKGTDDDRYLWDETIRVIRECKPRWFIGENVEGIINIQEGVVLRQVCDDLEKEGFEVQCLVIPASGIGAWHQRKRVWILAYSEHNGSHRSERNETIESSNEQEKRLSVRDDKDVPNTNSIRHRRWSSEGCTNERWSFLPREQEGREMGSKAQRCDGDDANTNSEGSQGHGVSTNMETKQRQVSSKNSIEEQQTWWEAQSSLCRNVNGISYELDKDRANRIKSLGNSIVPLIARELGLAIIKAETDG
ncbi:DNA (cytosine-5-)-methyltransferase (TIGR00675) [uncultured Mediterranean phage uvMED]|nr:DNA (cytosine-5-)-methyltransferase (TIGR00675) [uncultured Mediterranean phage uvMED]BAR37598.1 DNA (cytosine-5-)-methyltransferase (TIGR00675) [uncultured Mediterranean phage uvMED]